MTSQYSPNKPELEPIVEKNRDNAKFLILYNDEVHTFDYVIDSLIEICDIDPVQAEQITFLVHYKGKCDVIKGSVETLNPYRRGLVKKGLKASIN